MNTRHEDAGLRGDVREAIELSLPDDVVDLTFDPNDSYFWDVQPKLEAALAKVGSAMLLYERDVQEERGSWSYFLYFVSTDADRTGLAIGVSLLAPFAVITESAMEVDEDGVVVAPSLSTDETPEPDPDLAPLRQQVAAILERRWITVLPEEEWRKPVPWLTWHGPRPVRVVDALFFEVIDAGE